MQSTAAEGALDFPGVKGLQVTKQGPGTSEQHKAGGTGGEQQEGLKVDFRVNFQASAEFLGHVSQGGSGHNLA